MQPKVLVYRFSAKDGADCEILVLVSSFSAKYGASFEIKCNRWR